MARQQVATSGPMAGQMVTTDEGGTPIDAFGAPLPGYEKKSSPAAPAEAPAAAAPPAMAALGGGSGGAAPSAASGATPAMSSLMQQGNGMPDPGDVSQSGPAGLRAGLGTRTPPQYNYALASLQRGIY